MHTWKKNDEITAEWLNASQIRPHMEAINKSGAAGGLDQTVIDPGSTLACFDECDPGSVEFGYRAEITEHEVGNMKYEWNPGGPLYCARGMGRWQLESGWAGVTGQEQKAPEGPAWIENCEIENFASGNNPAYAWDKITTNKWGTPLTITRVYDSCKTHSTTIWNPSANEGGTIWRQMGHIKMSDVDLGSRDATCYDTHIWEAVNYNSAVIMPVTRPIGRSFWDYVDIKDSTNPDYACRYNNSHYIPIAGNVTGNTVPVISLGETGGTALHLIKRCGDCQGIGISAGVEFYDNCTLITDYNETLSRPDWKTATADIGYGGSVKVQALKRTGAEKGTCSSPWQFLLTATPIKVDCMEQDMGSTVTRVVTGNFWDIWATGVARKTEARGFADGQSVEGSIRAGYTVYTCDYNWSNASKVIDPNIIDQYYNSATTGLGLAGPFMAVIDARPTCHLDILGTIGEVKQGVMGIPQAFFDPGKGNGHGTASSKFSPSWNQHGGIIRGIRADIPLNKAAAGTNIVPHIDEFGFIHIYAPYIPECFNPNRFDDIDCYIHYCNVFDLEGNEVELDPWNT